MVFDYAKITRSRLMGSMGLIIRYEEDEKYIYQYDKILQDEDSYENIKILAEGAQEMFITG